MTLCRQNLGPRIIASAIEPASPTTEPATISTDLIAEVYEELLKHFLIYYAAGYMSSDCLAMQLLA